MGDQAEKLREMMRNKNNGEKPGISFLEKYSFFRHFFREKSR